MFHGTLHPPKYKHANRNHYGTNNPQLIAIENEISLPSMKILKNTPIEIEQNPVRFTDLDTVNYGAFACITTSLSVSSEKLLYNVGSKTNSYNFSSLLAKTDAYLF